MSDLSAERAQWFIEAEDGVTTHTSQEIAEAVAAGSERYTLGPRLSRVVRAYTRPGPDAAWVPMSTPPESVKP